MKPDTRYRATRAILASLIHSDLTAVELREVARLLEADPAFSAELGRVLGATAGAMGVRGAQPATTTRDPGYENSDHAVFEVLRMITHRRVTKHEILSVIKELYPGTAGGAEDRDMTIEALVRRAVMAGDNDRAMMFVDRLRKGRAKPDEYLKGIMERAESRQ